MSHRHHVSDTYWPSRGKFAPVLRSAQHISCSMRTAYFLGRCPATCCGCVQTGARKHRGAVEAKESATVFPSVEQFVGQPKGL
jgi:hypothetical protein